jgi:hypothetical protein
VFFALLFFINTRAVLAADFLLDWSQIGFVDGTSGPQTFTNVNNSGVDITTEVRVLNSAFQDIGLYIPGTSLPNIDMPRPDGTALAVRDISIDTYPGSNIGYIVTKITFSENVAINYLWMESFFNWTGGGVRKHMALQAFDENGNGLVPESWITDGGSDLIVEPHPSNGEPWLRSSYPNTQINYSGAYDIEYGSQLIKELYWYSWGYLADDSFSHVLGSSLLGDFEFSTEEPTVINLVSAGTTLDDSEVLVTILLAFLLVCLITLITVRHRPFKTQS